MEQLIMVFYVIIAAAMIGLILLQQGKGADMGASFGSGASQTLFGSAGSGNALTRATAILATVFFLASIGLAVMAKHKAEAARNGGIPVPAVSESREVPQAPGELPASASQPGAGQELPVSPPGGAEDVPTAPGQQNSVPETGNPAAHDVPSAPAEQPAKGTSAP